MSLSLKKQNKTTNTYSLLFIWLHWVLVVAWGIFSCSKMSSCWLTLASRSCGSLWERQAVGPCEKGTIGEHGCRTEGMSSVLCDPSYTTCHPVSPPISFTCVLYLALSPQPGHKLWQEMSLCAPRTCSSQSVWLISLFTSILSQEAAG